MRNGDGNISIIFMQTIQHVSNKINVWYLKVHIFEKINQRFYPVALISRGQIAHCDITELIL